MYKVRTNHGTFQMRFNYNQVELKDQYGDWKDTGIRTYDFSGPNQVHRMLGRAINNLLGKGPLVIVERVVET